MMNCFYLQSIDVLCPRMVWRCVDLCDGILLKVMLLHMALPVH
jgi:hypothetical protein